MGSALLVVDYGTASTVAVVRRPGRSAHRVEFDGSPVLPSAVFVAEDGRLETGRSAVERGRLLGEQRVAVVEFVAATLRRVHEEATRAAGAPVGRAVLIVPAGWRPWRRRLLRGAAVAAGLPEPKLVRRPRAVATYCTAVLGHPVEPGRSVVTYHVGAGESELAVVRRTGTGFELLSTWSQPIGGLHLDAVVARRSPAARERLADPRLLFESLADSRAVREALSNEDSVAGLTRAEFENAARPVLATTLRMTHPLLRQAGLLADEVAGWFLSGGVTNTPLVAAMVERAAGSAPVVASRSRFAAVEGALRIAGG